VEVATSDDLRRGLDVVLPNGGDVRDGRVTPVSSAFPVRVKADERVRLSFANDVYRAEVLDDASVEGTREITPTTTPRTPGVAGDLPYPGLGASESSLWIEPRRGGRIVVLDDEGEPARTVGGLFELVAEAERLHLVAEVDVEEYLAGLDLRLPDRTPLAPEALEAAVIAARSYALRAAAAELRVGRFHLHGDSRSLPWVGSGDAPPGVAAAVAATTGRVRLHSGQPIAGMLSVSAGGRTASPTEVFGRRARGLPYLEPVAYPAGEFRWRVEMNLAEVARRLGYDGTAPSLVADRPSPTGRPQRLVVDGSTGRTEYAPADFHAALGLPSSRFELAIEQRAEPVPAREDSPAFQEVPGTPIADAPLLPADESAGGGRRLPPVYVLAALALLGLALTVLLVANLQRATRRRRERRRARRHHPARRAQPAIVFQPPPETGPDVPAEVPEAAPAPAPPVPPEPPTDGPVTALDPNGDGGDIADELEHEDDDEDEVPETRSLREVLGWDDAPDWLDDPDARA
jgi:SpoIID/LytB domain protein